MHLTKTALTEKYSAQGTPICGFVSYIHPEDPTLLRRMGRQIGSDVSDAFQDSVSYDNGLTWSEPRASLSHIDVPGGHLLFVENATHYCPRRNILVHFTDQFFQPGLGDLDPNHANEVRITVAPPTDFIEGTAKPSLVSDFGFPQGLAISFTHILEDSRGRLLVTVQRNIRDVSGRWRSLGLPKQENDPDVLADAYECALLIGTWNEDDTLSWTLGNAVPFDLERSSRGLFEGTLAEMPNGRLAMVLRGSNAACPEKPGYKWVSFSQDGGVSWSVAEPLGCDDGSVLQSSSTGSLLLRSESGQLYWIGNVCLNGEQANGNFPRSPLVIAKVQEEPFALRRDTITVIADRAASEDEFLQLSNFRYYRDRASDEAVMYLTRFGERGSKNDDWMLADCYEYRVQLD